MKISQVLKDIRQQNQLTQEALAERLKVSRSAIARWESEKVSLILEISLPSVGSSISDWTHSSRRMSAWRKRSSKIARPRNGII